MKNSLLRTFFEWACITSVLMSVGFFGWYFTKSRAVRGASNRLAVAQADLQNNRAVMGMLLSECQAYGKTNADMARLLAAAAASAPANAAAPAPTTKPGAK